MAAVRDLPHSFELLCFATTMESSQIEALIRAALPEATVRVHDQTGTGDHFEAVIVSPTFAEKGLVERHQLIYGSLKDAMAGPIHALSLKTYTPDEWAKLR